MKTAVMDFVRRVTGGNEAVAELCAAVVADIEEGCVCRKVDAGERKMLLAEPRVVAAVAQETPFSQVETPFVLQGGLLYTRRNWVYERSVERDIHARAKVVLDAGAELPEDGFYGGLREEQRTAVSTMCGRLFSILTGGPGTGKTHTIARAVKFVRDGMPGLRLGLAAPTGKAAQRMKESMQNAGMENVPDATTLHSLLGTNRDFVTFKHNRGNPLSLDWLIVDEASMIGLPMMAKLLDALPPTCRLTLVGDVDQLASVERGHVFGDLCRMDGVAISRLSQSARFRPDGEIARLATAVNGGLFDEAMAVLSAPGGIVDFHDLVGADPFDIGKWPDFMGLVRKGFATFAACGDAAGALRHVNDFRVLCALRHGPYGSLAVNEFIQERLGSSCPVPMMVTHNDNTFGVANGDVGVVMPDDPGMLVLPCGNGIRKIRLELLADAELAFATTIHKSQGSEYGDVAVVMPPDGENPLLTREILYTGITRTKGAVNVFAGEDSVRSCCAHPAERTTGLA